MARWVECWGRMTPQALASAVVMAGVVPPAPICSPRRLGEPPCRGSHHPSSVLFSGNISASTEALNQHLSGAARACVVDVSDHVIRIL